MSVPAPKFCLHEHCQYRRGTSNIYRDGYERLRHWRMIFRQCLNTITRQIQLINFRHNCFKSHGDALFLARLRGEEFFRWTALAQRT